MRISPKNFHITISDGRFSEKAFTENRGMCMRMESVAIVLKVYVHYSMLEKKISIYCTCVVYNGKREAFSVITDHAMITGLNPTAEYCVGVAASGYSHETQCIMACALHLALVLNLTSLYTTQTILNEHILHSGWLAMSKTRMIMRMERITGSYMEDIQISSYSQVIINMHKAGRFQPNRAILCIDSPFSNASQFLTSFPHI